MELRFAIDTNCINALQKDAALNQIERWVDDGVIDLLLPEAAFDEVIRAGSPWRRKANRAIVSEDRALTEGEHGELKDIESIVFPDGCKTANDRIDVRIVFNANKYGGILITTDGASRRQPRGILGSADALRDRFSLRVVRPDEAVQLVRDRIKMRDTRLQSKGGHLPSWVGRD